MEDLTQTSEARFIERTLGTAPDLESLGCCLMVSTWLNTEYPFNQSYPCVAQTAV